MTKESEKFLSMLWRNMRPDFPVWERLLSQLSKLSDRERDSMLEGLPGYPDRVAPYYELKKQLAAWVTAASLGRLRPYIATGNRHAVQLTLDDGRRLTGYGKSFGEAVLMVESELRGT